MLPARACAGQAPRPCGRRRPSTKSASPSRTSRTKGTSRDGSSEASQSQKHTMSAVAASSPAWQAAPNPRRSSCTTVAPRPRASSAEPSVDPLSTTSARQPAGMRASTQGRASASFRQGRTTSTGAGSGSVAGKVVTAFTLRARFGHIGLPVLTKRGRRGAKTGGERGRWDAGGHAAAVRIPSRGTRPEQAPGHDARLGRGRRSDRRRGRLRVSRPCRIRRGPCRGRAGSFRPGRRALARPGGARPDAAGHRRP